MQTLYPRRYGRYVLVELLGTAALREFLAGRWDVAREARLRDTAIAEATPLLVDVPPPPAVAELVRRRGRVPLFLGGFVLVAAVGVFGVVWLQRAGGDGKRPALPPISVRVDASVRQPDAADSGVAPDVHLPAPATPAPLPATPAPLRRPVHARIPRAPEQDRAGAATRAYVSLLAGAEEAYRSGAVEQAIAMARRAAEVGGGARARIVAGGMLVHEGRLREAEAEFAAALRVAPDNAEAAAWLEKVREGMR